MASELILYTTLGCTLCEKAKPEIWPVVEAFDLRLKQVDIADDEQLMQRFATSIPAVGLGDPGDVCLWPFDQARLAEWISERL
ncbi:glutaredoxin family protein [Microbulbifer guangxiensis]|uniref:glutaredoxin family protein n=1 Tax=Microbulbifer guangxiensis TaxID=2904249 RepID=UPI001F29296A|nr:glutaredoxin family protein [Microbulbifer guangxiensis]